MSELEKIRALETVNLNPKSNNKERHRRRLKKYSEVDDIRQESQELDSFHRQMLEGSHPVVDNPLDSDKHDVLTPLTVEALMGESGGL